LTAWVNSKVDTLFAMPEWSPVLSCEGFYRDFYEVSKSGIVRSVDRFLKGKDGSARWVRGQEITPRVRDDGSFAVNLWRDNHYHQVPVGRVVLEAFDRPKPVNMDAEQVNGDPADNRLPNLEWRLEKRLRNSRAFRATRESILTPVEARKLLGLD
jgi:NUMOD4 motif